MRIGYDYITRASDLDEVIRAITETNAIGLDLETVGSVHDPEGWIRLAQISTGKRVFVIDLLHVGKEAFRKVAEAISDPGIIKIIQFAKFEQQWFWSRYQVELYPVFDTWRASSLIDNGRKELKHDLYSIYERYLGLAPPTEDMGGSDWSAPTLTAEQKDYAASDVIHLHALRERMKPILAKKGLNQVALIEFRVILPESKVELRGFPVDTEMWLNLAKDSEVKAEELRRQLIRELPNPKQQMTFFGMDPDFNIDSTQQILASLTKLGVEVADTKEMTLAMHAAEYPLINKLLEYRMYAQRVKTFGADYLENLCKHCGRFHSRYYPFTGAGRYSCAGPNLQQIPRDEIFRACFRPRKGRAFVISDWSNIEMRIIAEITGDPYLTKVFLDQRDAHYATASILTGKDEKDVTKGERQQAKPVNFGFIYGMQAPKLVLYARANYGVVLSLKEAREFREKFFEVYQGIQSWHEREFASKSQILRTKTGRLRYVQEDAYNERVNTPSQGLGADGLKTALYIVDKALTDKFGHDTFITHHVHDEIIVETDDDEEKMHEVGKTLQKGMEDAMQLYLKSVPVEAEYGFGTSWAAK